MNPALALPYWDFTYDAASKTNATSGDDDDDTSGALSRAFFQSELWKEDIFGDHINGNHTAQSDASRTNSSAMNVPTGAGPTALRAPWNVNKSPHVGASPALRRLGVDFGEAPDATHSALAHTRTRGTAR